MNRGAFRSHLVSWLLVGTLRKPARQPSLCETRSALLNNGPWDRAADGHCHVILRARAQPLRAQVSANVSKYLREGKDVCRQSLRSRRWRGFAWWT